MSIPYQCPYCEAHSIIFGKSAIYEEVYLDVPSRYGVLAYILTGAVCSNKECQEISLKGSLHTSRKKQSYQDKIFLQDEIETYALRPLGMAKNLPDFIPQVIVQDYTEATKILDFSPKSAATLARRVIQAMLRDKWQARGNNLEQEIKNAQSNFSTEVLEAIDATRIFGNIGAHTNFDVNLIVEVEPHEASDLIGLVEYLIDEWYIEPKKRQARLERIKTNGASKAALKDKNPLKAKLPDGD
ncbi:MAG: DUF4145 domain-containing protein [Pedobacter sp.]|nr:MAG: DUF4145 domain-containing protein [Pedobacter sp.]